jgi:ribosomal protein S6--L-glutamate ligase
VHLTILSRSAAIYTTRRIAEAARGRGHRVRVLDPVRVDMGLGGRGPELFYDGRPFPRTDAVVPRIAASITRYGLAVVNQLQLLGVPMLNGGEAIAVSRDKMRCLQILAANGVGIPHTVMASDSTGLMELAKHVGGAPVIVKLLTSDEKAGVIICESLQSLEAALEAILGLGQDIIVQQYVKGARGRDLRALVVGGKVVAAVRRKPRVGRFSRTLARGAEFEPTALTAPQARAAVAAARVIGLEVCGVDMLDVKGNPLVFEVNSSPGIKDAEQSCGVDVAEAIVLRAEEIALERRRPPAAPRPRGQAAGGR